MVLRSPSAVEDTTARFASDVARTLRLPGQKELLSRYLYDDVGSALFEAICLLPEYGLTRADDRLLRRHAPDIVDRLPAPLAVAELGSGSGRKTRWILQAACRRQSVTYMPIEISIAALERCEAELGQMESVHLVGFEQSYLDGLRSAAARRREDECLLVLFLGSSIGNFDRPAGDSFLRAVRRALRAGDALLLGTDLLKPVPVLMRAYDDDAGVTAAFNKNLLARLNRELSADFDLSAWSHEARYNDDHRRVEMHLRSAADQAVVISEAGLTVEFARHETIWTESSHKYDPGELSGMADRTGFRLEAQWIDREWPFAQNLLIAT